MGEDTTGSSFPTTGNLLHWLIEQLHIVHDQIGAALKRIDGTVVETSRGLVVIPGDLELQCRARTKQGHRCRNYVLTGQLWFFPYEYNIGAGLSEKDEELIFAQLCLTHGAVEPVFPPDWYIL